MLQNLQQYEHGWVFFCMRWKVNLLFLVRNPPIHKISPPRFLPAKAMTLQFEPERCRNDSICLLR